MKAVPRAEFEKWYYANKDNQFDFQKELEYYCHLDVDILTEGCLRFREILMKVCFSIAFLSAFCYVSFIKYKLISGTQGRPVRVCHYHRFHLYAYLPQTVPERRNNSHRAQWGVPHGGDAECDRDQMAEVAERK